MLKEEFAAVHKLIYIENNSGVGKGNNNSLFSVQFDLVCQKYSTTYKTQLIK